MTLTPLPDYPWDLMAPLARLAAGHPEGVVDLSIGSPVDSTPVLIRDALARATDAHAYPTTVGTPQLREAIASWFARRRGVRGLGLDEVMPTIGSKELVAWLPFLLGLGEGDVVVHPRVAYPTYAMGAAIAGAEACASDDPEEWPETTRLVWLNSPGNPDGSVLDLDALRHAVARARTLGATIVGDECYAELGWDGRWATEPIPSILDPRVIGEDRHGVLCVYSLSKQSNLAGYRAAFAAGDASLISRLVTVRKHAGMILPAPLQAAMVVALGDDDHVAAQKELYRARRARLRPALETAGFRVDRSEAGLYLWATEGRSAWESIERLARGGILAGPGVFYGEHSPKHVRLSLTATDERIEAATHRLVAGL
ncbi:succinyldiaminopimelate transaminase [Rathayibacter toxicus]|uniref:Aminotransferase n=1 Tax=Rathayibacter toxicus TaxID=145458 RepID=A0A0C5BF30_9MICO|nr:succinyldiaminopimelate transaminase [Rathayibacter toxicus]AJM77921.1 N-succinyldiaminopimelate aminotransferase [Rathayibacter toxicus]ALS57880.1 succinyldiaminopimelate transaminase [Rathayibacter toxicus]KKM46925.1 N-succinyldiaminopimelate aminotransferase [Rathayibacter toxicus]PPG20444.1 succinyldiaminopimelate transaminase [Rathayibacter toxicus]PPG45546.1 succinyldiaminopimelate transaminase [Rathayibacter toxicus]